MDINEAFRPTVAGDLRMPTVFVALPVVAVAAMRAIAERLSTLAPVAPSATGSGSAVRADVTSAAAGAQNGALTLRAAADRYARCAVVGPSPFSTGNTMIMLDQGGDSGDIVGQRVIPIGPEDTCASVYRDVGQAGADMLTAHLPALLAGNIGAGTYPNLGSFTNNRFGRNQRPDSAKQMSIPKAAVCTIAGNVFDDDGTPVPSAGSDPHAPQTRPIAAPCPRLRWGGFTSFYVPAIAASTTAHNCSHCRAASPSAPVPGRCCHAVLRRWASSTGTKRPGSSTTGCVR